MTPNGVYSDGWLGRVLGVAFEGWISAVETVPDRVLRRETIDGPGIYDPWKDPWMGRRHQEEDEVVLCLAAWLAELN